MKLQKINGHARLTMAGPLTWREAWQQVGAALKTAREQQVERLLVEMRGLQGDLYIPVGERYALGQALAPDAAYLRRIAFVMDAMALSVYEFTFMVISNRGPRTAGFISDAEAQGWLYE
jgi:hypothetical protein